MKNLTTNTTNHTNLLFESFSFVRLVCGGAVQEVTNGLIFY